MKNIGITVKPQDGAALRLAFEMADWLTAQGIGVHLSDEAAPGSGVPLAQMAKEEDFMVVLGGDGSLLHTARRFVGSRVPILGINLGRLGFLTEAPGESAFDVMSQVLQRGFRTESHFALYATCLHNGEVRHEGYAINDVVLQRNRHPRMIEFEMEVRGQFVFRLRADGLVLATPAGSTAYSLSAGGAIVHPGIDGISVVPISPHTLSNRPIILPAEDEIELRLIDSPQPAALNLDGQEHLELLQGDIIRVRKAGSVLLAYLKERNYYQVLHSKLRWSARTDEAHPC